MTVEAGDVLGTCIFDPPDPAIGERRELDIVGDVDGESLLEINSQSICTLDTSTLAIEIPQSVVKSQLSARSGRRLHLHANIGTIILCNGS